MKATAITYCRECPIYDDGQIGGGSCGFSLVDLTPGPDCPLPDVPDRPISEKERPGKAFSENLKYGLDCIAFVEKLRGL